MISAMVVPAHRPQQAMILTKFDSVINIISKDFQVNLIISG
jgi:hypothetical protein